MTTRDDGWYAAVMRAMNPSQSPSLPLRTAITAITLAAQVPLLVPLVACGRTNPNGGTDAAEIEATARAVAFDTEEELTLALDDDYLAGDTVLLQPTDVQTIATDIATDIATTTVNDLAFNDVAELQAELDTVYLRFDSTNIPDAADVETIARDACVDTQGEVQALVDGIYLQQDGSDFPTIAFADLSGIPNGLADGDNNTVVSAVAPLSVNGAGALSISTAAPLAVNAGSLGVNVAAPLAVSAGALGISTAGCTAGEAITFDGANFICTTPDVPLSPADAVSVGSATANTRPFEGLPSIAKVEVAYNIAAANGTQDIAIYNVANPPPHDMLIVDTWAVVTVATTGAPTWKLRNGATDVTDPVAVGALNSVGRVAGYNNLVEREVSAGDTLVVRVTADGTGGAAGTITVFTLGIPVP